MVNNSSTWQATMQLLQVKTEGLEFRDQLYECAKLCYTSHTKNVKDEDIVYAEIIDWPGGTTLPPGWIILPNGKYVKMLDSGNEQNETEGGNDGGD